MFRAQGAGAYQVYLVGKKKAEPNGMQGERRTSQWPALASPHRGLRCPDMETHGQGQCRASQGLFAEAPRPQDLAEGEPGREHAAFSPK